MLRRVLICALLLASAIAVSPLGSVRADEQEGCRSSLGLGAITPVDTNYCDGAVRPGVEIRSSIGGCTANFLFAGANGKRYLGTAGHCLLAGDGEATSFGNMVVQANVNGWKTIGRPAYAVLDAERDFALIELDAGVAARADMAHFGGPTGVYTSQSVVPEIVHHYGHGIVVGDMVPARTSIAPNTINHSRIAAAGLVVFGDSGGPAIVGDGRALGVIVTLGQVSGSSAGTVGISRLDNQLPRAAAALGTTLTIQTAPRRA